MNPLRFACMSAAAVFAGSVLAQTPAMPPPMPANVAPPSLPVAAEPSPQANVPLPPLEEYRGGTDEPQVTIIRKDTETVEEVRVGGVLRYVRVTPRIGRPYYLVPTNNGQNLTRQDSLGSGLSVPMWLLFSW